MTAPRFLDLRSVDVESGVNEKGEPFCKVRATADGVVLLGQLDPATMRTQGLNFFEAAEAAEHEAAMFRACRKLELPDGLAAMVIVELRRDRGQ